MYPTKEASNQSSSLSPPIEQGALFNALSCAQDMLFPKQAQNEKTWRRIYAGPDMPAQTPYSACEGGVPEDSGGVNWALSLVETPL
jgi:hypothetical protein